jgi:Ca2+-binding RTX toxin-like protein
MSTIVDNDLSHSIFGTVNADSIFAQGGNDAVRGGGGADFISGGSGIDVLFGDEGNDTFIGGTGGDTMDGGSGIDTVDYSTDTTGVVVDLSVNFGGIDGGSSGNDTLISIENVLGTNLNDFFIGTSGNNVLNGLGGNDIMSGGFGSDKLTGGAGANTFKYQFTADSLPGTSHDVITDFVHGVDKIDLKFIDAIPSVSGDQAFRFVAGAGFGFEGDLRVAFVGGNTLIQGNTDTDSTPEFEIQLSGLHPISNTDFIL